MAKFEIRYGLGGGFGGCESNDWEEIEAENEERATDEAYTAACEEYDRYDGMHGLRSVSQIMEEEDVNESDAEEIWTEERESWLDYEVRPVA